MISKSEISTNQNRKVKSEVQSMADDRAWIIPSTTSDACEFIMLVQTQEMIQQSIPSKQQFQKTKEDTRAPEEANHTKVITTQLTHPFHQGRNDSILAIASMISLAKILRLLFLYQGGFKLCHKLLHPEYLSLIGRIWMREEKLYLPMVVSLILVQQILVQQILVQIDTCFFNPCAIDTCAKILVQQKLRYIWMSPCTGQGLNRDVLKIYRWVQTLSLQVSSLAKGQFMDLLTIQRQILFAAEWIQDSNNKIRTWLLLFFHQSFLTQSLVPHDGIGSTDLSASQGPSPAHRSKSSIPSKSDSI